MRLPVLAALFLQWYAWFTIYEYNRWLEKADEELKIELKAMVMQQ